jgi:hypothetical protein
VHFNDAQWAALDDTIDAVERAWQPCSCCATQGARAQHADGTGSEAFCRASHRVMLEIAVALPRDLDLDLDLDEMTRDLTSHDRPALRRTRIDHLQAKLVIDVMDALRRGYAILKLNGRVHGLEGLRRELGKRFEQSARSKPDVAIDAG